MKNLFNSIQLQKPKKNVFDLTHDVKLSCNMGNLIPVMVTDTVPGDKFTIGAETLVRFAPLIAPVMHRMDVSIHYFFVPNRILWPNWEKFIVEPGTDIVAPYFNYDGSAFWDDYYPLMDYMGIPKNTSAGAVSTSINALPFAAYTAIYNEYYRDQNLIPEVDYKLTDAFQSGSVVSRICKLRNRAWEHDYFTASLPFAQKGAAVDIPLGKVQLVDDWASMDNPQFQGVVPTYPTGALDQVNNAGDIQLQIDGTTVAYNPNGTLETEPTTINELRRAFRLQEWLERNARGGTRYIENILAHFGVKSSDARLQRPEYITGIKTPVVISEVLNTTGESGGLPQGNMAGHGIAVTTGKSGSYYCEEHGWIIGIMSIMPKTAYQQGLQKMFSKFDNLDYFWPSFAHIGEQEVKNVEVFAHTATQGETFGYVPRYAEYKYIPSRVAGEFKTNLDYWHLGRIFATQPALNQEFVECDPADTKRIFAVTEGADTLYCHVLNKVTAVRPMPKFGTPML